MLVQIEAHDPASGATYYYDESTGKSQWERPTVAASALDSTLPSQLPENWKEFIDETTGMLMHLTCLATHCFLLVFPSSLCYP